MVMVTMMVNVCGDDCYLVMKVILVKEVMPCDVSPVAMFFRGTIFECHAMRGEAVNSITITRVSNHSHLR